MNEHRGQDGAQRAWLYGGGGEGVFMGFGSILKVTLLERSLFFYFKYLQKKKKEAYINIYCMCWGGKVLFLFHFFFLSFFFLLPQTYFKNKWENQKKT